MTHASPHLVATLVSVPGGLDAAAVARAAAVLPQAGAPRWLAAATAADLPFAPRGGSGETDWIATIRAALEGAPVDAVVQPAAGRRKRLLVADMDSTLIAEECIDELAAAHGCGAAVAALTARSTRGAVEFCASLRERVALLRGLPFGSVAALAARVTPVPGARVLAATMRAHGATTIIASGGFTAVTGPVAARLGFDRHHGNILVVDCDRLAGTLREPLLSPASKRDLLCAARDELGLAAPEVLAVGDGANDLPMLREAGLGVAFRAKPAVAAAVPARVDHGDLTALLYLQGYAREEFAA